MGASAWSTRTVIKPLTTQFQGPCCRRPDALVHGITNLLPLAVIRIVKDRAVFKTTDLAGSFLISGQHIINRQMMKARVDRGSSARWLDRHRFRHGFHVVLRRWGGDISGSETFTTSCSFSIHPLARYPTFMILRQSGTPRKLFTCVGLFVSRCYNIHHLSLTKVTPVPSTSCWDPWSGTPDRFG
jgi:hypothetical protein